MLVTWLSWCKNKRISEYWDINKLIYCIEKRLPNFRNAVLSLVVLYLSAESDLTDGMENPFIVSEEIPYAIGVYWRFSKHKYIPT